MTQRHEPSILKSHAYYLLFIPKGSNAIKTIEVLSKIGLKVIVHEVDGIKSPHFYELYCGLQANKMESVDDE